MLCDTNETACLKATVAKVVIITILVQCVHLLWRTSSNDCGSLIPIAAMCILSQIA